MKRILLASLVVLFATLGASAQKVTTKVIDNKGTIKWVIDSTTAVITKGDSTILYVTPKQLRDSMSKEVNYTDTAAMLANYVNKANNGLTKTGQTAQLGGSLIQQTTIVTTATNFLAITGMTSGAATDSVMVVNPTTGKLSIVSASTLFGNLTANNGLTKTGNNIQLGGPLTQATVITTTSTNTLAVPGLQSGSLATDSIVVSDATTGVLRRVAAGTLLQSGDQNFTATAAQGTYTVTNMPSTVSKVWVYRNGAKLLGTTDYTVSGGIVTFSSPMATLVALNDIIEVQWVK